MENLPRIGAGAARDLGSPALRSSGDLVVDRRFLYAEVTPYRRKLVLGADHACIMRGNADRSRASQYGTTR